MRRWAVKNALMPHAGKDFDALALKNNCANGAWCGPPSPATFIDKCIRPFFPAQPWITSHQTPPQVVYKHRLYIVYITLLTDAAVHSIPCNQNISYFLPDPALQPSPDPTRLTFVKIDLYKFVLPISVKYVMVSFIWYLKCIIMYFINNTKIVVTGRAGIACWLSYT